MGEGIKSRVGRVLAGGLNKCIESFEGLAPDAVLEQTVREIDGAIEEVRSEYGRELAAKHLTTKRLFEANKKHDDLGERLEVALKEGRDDLAEAAIALQLDIEAQIPVIEQTLADIGEREQELEGYLRALQGRVREMREELTQYRSQRGAMNGANTKGSSAGDIELIRKKVDRAEAAFERLLERATGISSGGANTDLQSATKMAELDRLTRNHRIQERLAAHKVAGARTDDEA